MHYRITPLVLALLIAMVIAVISLLKATGQRKSLALTMLGFLLPSLAIVGVVDFLMQKYIPSPWILFGTEGILMAILAGYYVFKTGKKVIVLPDSFSKEFAVVVFEVEGHAPLPTGRNIKIQIPPDGILFTSSSETTHPLDGVNGFEYSSGKKLAFLTGDYQWAPCPVEVLETSGKKFYLKWWVHKSAWGNQEIDFRMKEEIKKKLSAAI